MAGMSRRTPILANRPPFEIEARIVVPSPIRVPHKLRKRGLSISPTGVRGVWQHHDLETMKKRLKAPEAKVTQEGLILTEAKNLIRKALAFLRLASIRLMHRKFCNLCTKLPDSL